MPYLHAATPAAVGNGPLRVGLAWAGAGGFAPDRQRSLRLAQVMPWFDLEGIEWVGPQKAVPPFDVTLAETTVAHVPRLLEALAFDDFAQTAARIAGVDLVVSVDTAVRIWPARWASRPGSSCPAHPTSDGCSEAMTAGGTRRRASSVRAS